MKFQYTALTRDNKKIAGVLDVPDRETAEAELHKMGVAIIGVREISAEEYERFQTEQEAIKVKKGIKAFQFLALDTNGKEVEGTIDALDDFSAYQRLREEYRFTVTNLYLSSATPEEKERAKSLITGFEDQLKRAQSMVKKEEKRLTAKESEQLTEESINEEIVAEIDRVIINARKALEAHGDLFSIDLRSEIEATLGELERIRSSNNIKHITEVSNNLYSLLSNPDRAEGEKAQDENYQALIGEIQNSALVKKQFEIYKKALEASGLKKIFISISNRLKDLTTPKAGEEKKPNFASRFKVKLNRYLETRSQKQIAKINLRAQKPKSPFSLFFEKLGDYFRASSPILKRTRRKELYLAFKTLITGKRPEVVGPTAKESKGITSKPGAKTGVGPEPKKMFSGLFIEADSFVAWLLSFYIIYFFLIDFSIEKDIGLSREFIYKTLKTPLLFDISVFLLLVHFTLRFRNLHFRHNIFASLFLFFFSIGFYILLMVNF